MKKLLIPLILIISFNSFSQSSIELNMSGKDYNKIVKKLDMNITNRGYDGAGKIWITGGGNSAKKLWNDALFEMDMPIGEVTGKNDKGGNIVDARWLIEIENGSYAFKVLDWSNNKKIAASISTKAGMWIGNTNSGRAIEYKNYVKVMINELLGTIKN